MNKHAAFDIEIIGSASPVFLVCVKIIETGKSKSFWLHREGDMDKLRQLVLHRGLTWVGFNSIDFDAPLLCAALAGVDAKWLKRASNEIITSGKKSWQTYRDMNIPEIKFDHIDLMEMVPGVMISLKTYAGRMAYKTMQDMPFHHDHDLSGDELDEVEKYCLNDIGVTEALFNESRNEIKLREQLGEKYSVDLRSKSDAQCAEAILKSALDIKGSDKEVPSFITYSVPEMVRTSSDKIRGLIEKLESEKFHINLGNGSPIEPEWMQEDFRLGHGTYKVGLGGLHSTHDVSFYAEATGDLLISDFDVASYYPNLMLKCGLIPRLSGGKGAKFIKTYKEIYEQRMVAKHGGDKRMANTLKIVLNGTFGKLGSVYSAFYSPDLMLAVTLTGQLNLLCLIYELERIDNVRVYSANTDGVTVGYHPALRDDVLAVFARNVEVTGFEYEETPYSKIAMKDVNNYIAVTTKGKIKRKGLYASVNPQENPLYLMKNPTMEVCANMATDYLLTGSFNVDAYAKMKDFVAIRNVKGGGVQHTDTELVDDWCEVSERVWFSERTGKTVKPRKSKPKAYEVGVGGKPFGRVARWYMTTKDTLPITYVGSGNQVAKTKGAMICMNLPDELPDDLDKAWYVKETWEMLKDMGVCDVDKGVREAETA